MTVTRGLQRRIKQHIAARDHSFFAIVQPGFEAAAARELAELGIGPMNETVEGGLEFTGKLEACYRVNLCSRTITRLLMRIATFRAEYFDRFHDRLREIPWELYLRDRAPISFHITAHKSRLYHTGRLAEEAKKAITSRFSEYGMTPSWETVNDEAWQTVHLRLDHDRCQVSLDTSGDELYKRGQKHHVTGAPLRETLAALILTEARVKEYNLVMDPLCGSGTFSLEAAGILSGQLPAPRRHFPFMDWPAFRPAAYNHLKKSLQAKQVVNPEAPFIFASDINDRAMEAARKNISGAGLDGIISLEKRDFFREIHTIPAEKKCLIVLNPPYGERLRNDDVRDFYHRLGKTLREDYGRCGVAVIVPGLEQEKALSLHQDRKILFMNGGIRVALLIRDGL
jgi:putative N6-adenine-specific DNA methylase